LPINTVLNIVLSAPLYTESHYYIALSSKFITLS